MVLYLILINLREIRPEKYPNYIGENYLCKTSIFRGIKWLVQRHKARKFMSQD